MKLLFNSLIILGFCGLLQGCNSDDVSGNTTTREALHINITGTPNGLWWFVIDRNTDTSAGAAAHLLHVLPVN